MVTFSRYKLWVSFANENDGRFKKIKLKWKKKEISEPQKTRIFIQSVCAGLSIFFVGKSYRTMVYTLHIIEMVCLLLSVTRKRMWVDFLIEWNENFVG